MPKNTPFLALFCVDPARFYLLITFYWNKAHTRIYNWCLSPSLSPGSQYAKKYVHFSILP